MPATQLHLDEDEICAALSAFDPVTVARDALIRRAMDGLEPAGPRRESVEAGLTLRIDDSSGTVEILPGPHLVALWYAAAAAAAARDLLSAPPVVAGVLGAGFTSRVLLQLLADALPGLSQVAIWAPDALGPRRLRGQLAPLFRRRGIDLSLVADATEAALGAHLVVANTADAVVAVIAGRLARGAVLIDTCGNPVPPGIIAEVFVEDPVPRPGMTGLGEVLVGLRPARTAADSRVLVLLRGAVDHRDFAGHLHRAAVRGGLGRRIPDG